MFKVKKWYIYHSLCCRFIVLTIFLFWPVLKHNLLASEQRNSRTGILFIVTEWSHWVSQILVNIGHGCACPCLILSRWSFPIHIITVASLGSHSGSNHRKLDCMFHSVFSQKEYYKRSTSWVVCKVIRWWPVVPHPHPHTTHHPAPPPTTTHPTHPTPTPTPPHPPTHPHPQRASNAKSFFMLR